MQINRLDAHDRLMHFTKQDFSIGECCQDIINKRPFGNHSFYIFAHGRTQPDGATVILHWQPRLTKPQAQENSMLFKAYPGTDQIKVIWMIPKRELWEQFGHGKMTGNRLIAESIDNFLHHKKKLEAKEEDDLSDEEIDLIYKDISLDANAKAFK